MALKDWRRDGTKADGDVAFYSKKNNTSIFITDDSSDESEQWDLVILSTRSYMPGTKTIYRETIESYSQALKFAKSYMRKH
jgi:hypothetical protein